MRYSEQVCHSQRQSPEGSYCSYTTCPPELDLRSSCRQPQFLLSSKLHSQTAGWKTEGNNTTLEYFIISISLCLCLYLSLSPSLFLFSNLSFWQPIPELFQGHLVWTRMLYWGQSSHSRRVCRCRLLPCWVHSSSRSPSAPPPSHWEILLTEQDIAI